MRAAIVALLGGREVADAGVRQRVLQHARARTARSRFRAILGPAMGRIAALELPPSVSGGKRPTRSRHAPRERWYRQIRADSFGR